MDELKWFVGLCSPAGCKMYMIQYVHVNTLRYLKAIDIRIWLNGFGQVLFG